MNLATVIATISLAIVLFLAIRYIVKEKMKGSKCVGCPYAEGCKGSGDQASIEAMVERCKEAVAGDK